MQDNKAIVQTFLEALGKGDVKSLQSLLSEDVQAICTGTSLLSGTRNYSDICAAAGFLGSVTQRGIDFRILTTTAEQDRVSAEVEGHSVLVDGRAYNNQYHFLFFFRDGRIYKLKEYIDTKLADAALGPLLQQAQ